MSEPTGLGQRELVAIALYEDCEGIKWVNARNDTRAEWRRIAQVALDASGDRSLLRAPTEKAKLAAWDAYCEDQALDLNQDIARAVDRAVEAAYAVDGLRGTACEGPNSHAEYQSLLATAEELAAKCDALQEAATVGTEDRALREGLEEIASEAYHAIPYYAYGDNEAARHLANRLEKIAGLVRVLQESVEGEQRT